jgi:hypothetical protein
MAGQVLLFWKAGPQVRLSAAKVARELVWGEDVEGVIDLPIKEIIDRLKAEFPKHDEQAGLLVGQGSTGSFEATWTWQHVKAECHDLDATDRERLINVIEEFGCMAYDPQPKLP